VTHLPQVAAYADQHVRVLKEPATDGRLVTKAEVLDREDTRVSSTGRCSVSQYSVESIGLARAS
jgi:DNA repair ATPase RecN